MLTRILGMAICIIGIVLLTAAIYGLHSADTGSHVLLEASRALHREFQPQRWKTHLTFYWASWALASGLAFAGGVFLLLRRQVGAAFVMGGSLVVLIYPFVVQILGERAYAFEYTNYPTAAVAALLIVISLANALLPAFNAHD